MFYLQVVAYLLQKNKQKNNNNNLKILDILQQIIWHALFGILKYL